MIGAGMDMEDLAREIKTNITRHVLTTWEIDHWLNGTEKICRELRIIFSIKETIYKCLNPLQGISLGFHDAEVLEMTDSDFTARLLVSPLTVNIQLPLILKGRLQEKDDIIFTAMIVSATDLTLTERFSE